MEMVRQNKQIIARLGFVAWALVASYATALNGGDFDVFLEAGRKLAAGQNIYEPPFVRDLQYYYSVFFALLLIPFSNHVFWTEVLWALLSFGFLYRIYHLFEDLLISTECPDNIRRWWFYGSFFFSLQFILYNIWLLQVTIFLLWAVMESLHLIRKKKDLLGAGLLALAINIKVMPILILPYLFYRGHFKALSMITGLFVLMLYLPALFIGQETNQFLLSEWWRIINPGNKEHLFETGIGTHSLVALLPVYLTDTVGDMDFKRNFLHLEGKTVEVIILISRLLLLALSLVYLKWPPFKKPQDSRHYVWELSYFCMLIPLLLPHQQKYAFLFALPALSYLVYFLIHAKQAGALRPYRFCLVFLLPAMFFFSPFYGSDVIGQFLFRLTQHYRCLTIACMLMIPIMMYCRPDKMVFTTQSRH